MVNGKYSFFCIFLCYNFLNLFATSFQEDSAKFHRWRVGAKVHYGFLVNHSRKIIPINEQAAFGEEVFVAKQTYGEDNWNQFFNYPEYGLCYTRMNIGSPDYVGTVQGVFPFMNFHLLNNNSPFNLDMRTGIGIAYVDKIYSADINPKNLAISMHFNYLFSLQLQGSYRINKDWNILGGTGLTHLSNGAYVVPNTGLNAITFFTGAQYTFGQYNSCKNDNISKPLKKWIRTLFISGGIKEIYPIGGNKYFVGNTGFELSRKHLDFTRFSGRLDINYDASDYDFLVNNNETPRNHLSCTKIGLAAGYHFIFDRLSAILQIGAYLYAKNTDLGIIYQRTALRYQLSDRICLQIALRNQRAVADYTEFGLGFCW